MRRARRSFGWFHTAPKKPPPAHGIKVRSLGATWWGERWIRALEEILQGDSARLARGRTYARAGRVHDLEVKPAEVTASVTGSRPTPYAIRIWIAQLSDAAWKRVITAMSEKASFSAALLAGEMPRDIDDAFRAAGTRLFPVERSDLATNCSCPDWGDPCKHVAAAHYVLGEAFDRDPFLLFELRGRTRGAVLDALRAARGVEAPRVVDATIHGPSSSAPSRDAEVAHQSSERKRSGRKTTAGAPDAVTVPTVAFGRVSPDDYDRVRAPLPALHLSFDAPAKSAAVIRQLGAPPSWTSTAAPADALAPVVRAAAETARRIALAESVTVDPTAIEEPPVRATRRSDGERAPRAKAKTRRR